ncbi:MAG: antitoxin VapB family protein [Candidatus Bilamarchaeaceae archaeon]
MVKVITIRDEVYVELNRLKKSKDMSFGDAIDYLLKQDANSKSDLFDFSGSVTSSDIDSSIMHSVVREKKWKRYV